MGYQEGTSEPLEPWPFLQLYLSPWYEMSARLLPQRATQEAGHKSSFWLESKHKGVSTVFCLIPASPFWTCPAEAEIQGPHISVWGLFSLVILPVTTKTPQHYHNARILPSQHPAVLQRRLYWEIQDLCFLVIHNRLSRSLSFSIHVQMDFVNMGIDKIKKPEAQDRSRKGEVGTVQVPINCSIKSLIPIHYSPATSVLNLPTSPSLHTCLFSLWLVSFILPCRPTGIPLLQPRSY